MQQKALISRLLGGESCGRFLIVLAFSNGQTSAMRVTKLRAIALAGWNNEDQEAGRAAGQESAGHQPYSLSTAAGAWLEVLPAGRGWEGGATALAERIHDQDPMGAVRWTAENPTGGEGIRRGRTLSRIAALSVVRQARDSQARANRSSGNYSNQRVT